jgi:hypothetical protein
MPQVTTLPPGQTVGVPAAQLSKSQPCSPARPGHSKLQREPAPQLALQLWSGQANRHSLFGPQLQLPFWHAPAHSGLSPAQRT